MRVVHLVCILVADERAHKVAAYTHEYDCEDSERLCFGVLKATCKHVDMTADMILAE